MSKGSGTPPTYDAAMVERVILEEAIELHPQRLTVSELSLRILADPDDAMEVEIATDAIRDLRRGGLLRYRTDDEVVEPTQAAFHAFGLLSG